MQAAKDAHEHAVLEDKERLRKRERRTTQSILDRRRRDLRRLLDTMVSRAGLGASDPRDMVYAHLGLAKDAGIQVDYTKSVAEIYHDIAWEAISTFGTLEILGYVCDSELERRGIMASSTGGITAFSEKQLASWAPNWTETRENSPYSIMQHTVDVAFELYADKYSSPYYFISKPTLLCTAGCFIGTLSEVGPVLQDIEKLPQSEIPHASSRSCQQWLMEMPGVAKKAAQMMWEDHLTRGTPLECTEEDCWYLINYFCRRRFIKSAKSIIDGRRLAILDGKMLALVPKCANDGDRVCVLEGCRVPFVVRDTDIQRNLS